MLRDANATDEHSSALAYFQAQLESNREYWRRIGGMPDFATCRVLDLGCGHGAMSVAIAEQTDARVVGIDINSDLIDFARQNLVESYPGVASRVEFVSGDLAEMVGRLEFDAVVSKDTFEHVQDVSALLRNVRGVLRPGGRLYVGFSPLYFSPFGGHGCLGVRLPWAHAVLPRRAVLRLAGRRIGREITQLSDIGLNGATPDDFRRAFTESRLDVVSMQYNQGSKTLMPAMSALRRYRVLEKYFTVGIYAVLERPVGTD